MHVSKCAMEECCYYFVKVYTKTQQYNRLQIFLLKVQDFLKFFFCESESQLSIATSRGCSALHTCLPGWVVEGEGESVMGVCTGQFCGCPQLKRVGGRDRWRVGLGVQWVGGRVVWDRRRVGLGVEGVGGRVVWSRWRVGLGVEGRVVRMEWMGGHQLRVAVLCWQPVTCNKRGNGITLASYTPVDMQCKRK